MSDTADARRRRRESTSGRRDAVGRPVGVRVLWMVVRRRARGRRAACAGTYKLVTLLAHEERTEEHVVPRRRHRRRSTSTTRPGRCASWRPRATTIDGDGEDQRRPARRRASRSRSSATRCELRGTCPNFGSDWCRVSYTISRPAVDLDVTVDADDGSVDVIGVTGDVDVDTDNGSIELASTVRIAAASERQRPHRGHRVCARRRCTPTPTTVGSTLTFVDPPTSVLATSNNGSVEVVVPDDGTAYRVEMDTDNGSQNNDAPARRPRQPTAPSPSDTDNGSVTGPHRPLTGSDEISRPGRVAPRTSDQASAAATATRIARSTAASFSSYARLLGLVALGDDGAHAAGGEAVDGAHLEQRAGLHLEVEDAEVVVLVDHPAQPPQQVRVRRRLRALLALEERVRRRHHADVVVDAEVAARRSPG